MRRQHKIIKSRRVRHKTSTKSKTLSSVIRLIVLTFLIVCGLFMLVIFKVTTLEKFIYLNKTVDGGAEIIIVDSQNDKLVKLLVPNDLMLDSAHGYGNYKLSSLWVLSEKDKIGGKLISESILKNFLIPVPLWKNGNSSNLNIFQRIKAFLVEKDSKDYDATISTKKISNSVLINFVNPTFVDNTPKIDIADMTGDIDTASKVSRIVEIIGGKVASNSKGYDEDLDCQISSKDKHKASIFAEVFDCNLIINEQEPLDIKIRLGAKFADRF